MKIAPDRYGLANRAAERGLLLCQPCAEGRVARSDRVLIREIRAFPPAGCPVCGRRRAVLDLAGTAAGVAALATRCRAADRDRLLIVLLLGWLRAERQPQG